MSFWSYKPYVSVGARQKLAEKAAAKAKKAGAIYSPVAASRGAIAKTVWGIAWCDNLEQYSDYETRLPRGRTYLRNGSVIDLQLTAGRVQARVMGSSLYAISVTIKPVAASQWKAICTDCSASIDSLVELLQGKLAAPVMMRITAPKTGLFPAPSDISFDCDCPDGARMCKHIAAVLYGVGARLDEQPELLFKLRQVDAKDLVVQAVGGLPTAGKKPVSSKVIDDADLADVFGLQMDGTPADVVVKAKTEAKSRVLAKAKPASKPRVAKPATAATAATKAMRNTKPKSALKAVAKKAINVPAKKIPSKSAQKSPAKPPAKVAKTAAKTAAKTKAMTKAKTK